jgi:hypothetical protein
MHLQKTVSPRVLGGYFVCVLSRISLLHDFVFQRLPYSLLVHFVYRFLDHKENTMNGIPRSTNNRVKGGAESVVSQKSHNSTMSFGSKLKMRGLRDRVKAGFTSRKQAI